MGQQIEAITAERSASATLLTDRVKALNADMDATGVRPRWARSASGDRINISSLPREVREFAREAIALVGIPRLVATTAFGSNADATAAINALRLLGMPAAVSTMDGEGGEETIVPGVVMFPMAEPLGEPPDDLTPEGIHGAPIAVVALPAEKRDALAALRSSVTAPR